MTSGTRAGRGVLWLGLAAGAALGARAWLRSARRISLPGQVVLITGGGRGLGLLMARELAQAGAQIAICGRDADELERARFELQSMGANVLDVPCDVTNREQVEAMVQDVHQRFGRIDVLINNAGVIEVGPMEAMTLGDYEEAMNTHFWAPLYVTMAVLPEMRVRRTGRIVNIASFGGKVSVPHMLPYSASKFALVGLSSGLRAELAKDGILVTTVSPGVLRTGSHENAVFKGQRRKEYTLFSLGGASPLVSSNAERAAHQIIEAMQNGDPEIVIGVQAQIASAIHGLFPGVTADVLGVMNRFLPTPGDDNPTARAKGADSHTLLAPSPLTAGIDREADRNNERG